MDHIASSLAFPRAALSRLATVIAFIAIGVGATALAALTQVPAVLVALLAGFLIRPAAERNAHPAATAFCSSTILRIGIALIGVRLSAEDLALVGWPAVALGVGAVAFTICSGTLIGFALHLDRARTVLSAGAVAICGASAALAVSAVLPPTPDRERQTCYTIAAVTILSTLAMVAYPLVSSFAGLTDTQAGLFFGAAIHDLTQVIGAGAMVSPESTEVATVTKLVRVSCLAPAVVVIGVCFHRGAAKTRPPLIPWFILAFAGAAFIASAGILSDLLVDSVSRLASLCLVTATVALGSKTRPREMLAAGWRPLTVVVLQTIALLIFSLVIVTFVSQSLD